MNRRFPLYLRPPGLARLYNGYVRLQPPQSRLSTAAIPTPVSAWRKLTTPVAVHQTGYIDVGPNEGLLFFDNIFPLQTTIFDLRYLITRLDWISFESRINAYIPPSLSSDPSFGITSITPRTKDGGAFVKFSTISSTTPTEISSSISSYLSSNRIKPWFSPLRRVKAYPVLGKPWLEDLRMYPSTRLRVEFPGADTPLSQETLFALFRRYGKISEITPQPAASKELPRYAYVQYAKLRSATAARSCLHGFSAAEEEKAGGTTTTTMRILYERTMKVHWIRDWVFSHPRIVVPIFAAVVAAITVAVFDPVRTWFIEARITRSLHFTESPYWAWLKKYTIGRLPLGRKGGRHGEMDGLWAVWDERKESVEQLHAWLRETVETFIVVQGPRGSGKKDLVVDTVLKGRKNVLVIDCEPIDEAHGDSATIAAAAAQVGYRPVFSWLNTISSLLDLAAQGTLGSSAGFSQTLETQLVKILQNTGTALKAVALKEKGKDMAMSDDEYLSTHPEKRPVVVIDNFLHMEGNSIIYERLADWAALLVSANVAHVIFLTNDTSFSKSLAKSLPDRVFRSILLGDAQPESAKRFVLKHISDSLSGTSNEKSLSELDDSIQALGGRLTDLESLARRIKTGESPNKAVQEIIETSASEILKLYFLEDNHRKKRHWTSVQAWYLVKALASAEQLPFNQAVVHDLFKFDEDALQNLEQAEMIQIVTYKGRPYSIRPGRPVYREAFKRLLEDKVLADKMDLQSFKALVKVETEVIETAEKELAVLAMVPGDKQLKARMEYLMGKVNGAHKKVVECENAIAELKKTLKTEY